MDRLDFSCSSEYKSDPHDGGESPPQMYFLGANGHVLVLLDFCLPNVIPVVAGIHYALTTLTKMYPRSHGNDIERITRGGGCNYTLEGSKTGLK